MGSGKGQNDKGKAVIIDKTAKGTSRDAIAKKLGRHFDTARRFLKDPSPRRQQSDCRTSETMTERDLRNIGRQFRGKREKNKRVHFHNRWLSKHNILGTNRFR